jgi:diguanylate cyclase (GGDEF)-like protein
MDLLTRELHRSHREQKSTAIILADVDHFKRVNDTLGHLVGDEVLMEIANRLLAAVRSYDFVGRYGGEEFLVVLNNCDPAFAPIRAEEIRLSISQLPIHTARGPLSLTMSAGLLLSSEWGVRPLEELLHQVDNALYEAKSAGRDCLRISKPAVAPEPAPAPIPQSLRLRH